MTLIHEPDQSQMGVLLVEDNPLDAKMFGRAAGRAGFSATVDTVETGEEALEALGLPEGNRYALLLLDLNLPGINGFDVLRHVKADASRKSMPVIVFSSSANQRDINRAYEYGAAAYVTKPMGFDGYGSVINAISMFWSNIVAYAS